MLTSPSPRTVREISHSSVLAEQGRLIAFPNRPPESSGVESLKLRDIWRPWRSFRLGWTFSSVQVCLRCKSRIAARIALPVIILSGMAERSYAQNAEWNPQNPGVLNSLTNADNWIPSTVVPTGIATFGPAVNEGSIPQTTEDTSFGEITFLSNAPSYDFLISPGNLTLSAAGIINPNSTEQNFCCRA